MHPWTKTRDKVFLWGFCVLAVTTLLLFGMAGGNAFRYIAVSGVILTLVMAGLSYQLGTELRFHVSHTRTKAILTLENLKLFLAVFLGTVLTYSLSVYLELGAVVASSVVGILAAWLFPPLAAAAFCGSFAGMSSAMLLSFWPMAGAGILAGVMYVASRDVLNGFGGKLGTIAFVNCLAAALLARSSLLRTPIPGWETGLAVLGVSVAAAVLTYVLNIRLKLGPVLASGVVGMVAGLVFPLAFPGIGNMLAVMAFCSSFVGMSSREKMGSEVPIAFAGILAALVYLYSLPWEGAGGKLGTIAFGSVLAVKGWTEFVSRIRKFTQKT